MPTRPSLEAVVLALPFVMALRPPPDADTFLHLATGRLVLAGTIPTTDPFSHTIAGHPWLAHEWLAATLMETIHRAGGLPLLVWAGALASLAVLLLVRRLLDLEEVRSPLARIAALMAAAVCLQNVAMPRPHLVTILFLAAELVLLARLRRGGSLATLALLPPAFVAWGNCHGGFILGGLPLGMAGLDALADARAGDPAARRRFAALFACGLCCIAALTLNPHGAALLSFPFAFDARAPHLALIDEWKAPDYRSEARAQGLVLIALAIAPLLWPARARIGEASGLLASLHLALTAVRNQFMVGLTGAVPLARCLERGAQEGALAGLDARLARTARGATTALPLAALVLVAGLAAPRIDWLPRDRLPVDAAEWILATNTRGTLFNEYDHGGFLIWKLGAAVPVFVDGRVEIYHRDGVMDDYFALTRLSPGWEQVLERRKLDLAILPESAPLAKALVARGWRRVFAGRPASVFTR